MQPEAPLLSLSSLNTEPVIAFEVTAGVGHPVLKGHFPGNPVVPGVCIIQAVHLAVEKIAGKRLKMAEASQVKFLHPFLPDCDPSARLELSIESMPDDAIMVLASLSGNGLVYARFRGKFQVF